VTGEIYLVILFLKKYLDKLSVKILLGSIDGHFWKCENTIPQLIKKNLHLKLPNIFNVFFFKNDVICASLFFTIKNQRFTDKNQRII